METIEKVKDTTDWMDAPIESDKWRNLTFCVNGASSYGVFIHASEHQALQAVNKVEKEMAEGTILGIRTIDMIIPYDFYSHSVQMPVKE